MVPRIPVCAEARKYGLADPGYEGQDIDLVLKRSADNGATWSLLAVVEDPGERWSAANPATIVEEATGTVWLFYLRGKPNRNTETARPGTDDIEIPARTSVDSGLTWSSPIDLTSVTRDLSDARWRSSVVGPGGGIRCRGGRLAVPVWRFEPWGAFAAFSDDHGRTWRRGDLVPGVSGDECQLVELADGRLLLDIRQQTGPHRWRATSADGGRTWSDPRPGERTEPVCCAIERYALNFGYLKKMILTLHNILMMKRGRMPYHGAMVRIVLDNGHAASVLLIGDTAAGKSESLEAFRMLGRDCIRDLRIVADDMGSLDIAADGSVLAYRTEIGAFVRLDNLQQGYAFGQLDRAVIMSPQKVNARVVLPVTTLDEVLHGYRLDLLLYANNYEEVDDGHPIIEHFETAEAALNVFREGAAIAKGTTTSTGLVHSYSANIFGAPQYKELHEPLAEKVFKAAFDSGVIVGQLRTRLGIPGYETEGPEAAAAALLALIAERRT